MLLCACLRYGKTFLSKSVKPFIGGLLVALVVLMNLLAVAPSLHKIFHADAGESDHQCAVTLFAHGQVEAVGIEVASVVPSFSIELAAPLVISVFAPAIENLPAGRAPPVSVSPLV